MFGRRPTIEKLRGYKKMRLNGMEFTIQRINPLVDFTDGKMPMIFSSFVSRRKPDADQITPEALKKIRDEMGVVIRAGVVTPSIVSEDKASDGITVTDLFRDPDLAQKLYLEIMLHSLNQFSGWRGVFFSIKTRRYLFTALRNSMGSFQLT